jgi:hypothetical protein
MVDSETRALVCFGVSAVAAGVAFLSSKAGNRRWLLIASLASAAYAIVAVAVLAGIE